MCCRESIIILFCLFFVLFIQIVNCGDDYYEILGVTKDADSRTIRKAFKKLALLKHPDKNPNDKSAHDEFVKLNHIYQVLTNEELRDKYDRFGEDGLKDESYGGGNYESWQFYNEMFGIYDEDVEIITLSRSDFYQAASNQQEIWFINFYSSFCSHCHQLAPTWRKFAKRLYGSIRIGAVNCAEDPFLCQSEGIHGYPSLVLYPKRSFYQGHRTLESLSDFVLDNVKIEIIDLTNKDLKTFHKIKAVNEKSKKILGWLLVLCEPSGERCLSKRDIRLLSLFLDGIVQVAKVSCTGKTQLCDELNESNGNLFYSAGETVTSESGKVINYQDAQDIANEILGLLPAIKSLSADELRKIIKGQQHAQFMLIYFAKNADNIAVDLKKLPSKIQENISIHLVDCSSMKTICQEVTSDLPRWVMFKKRRGYEIFYGKSISISDVINFAHESKDSPLVSLDRESYQKAYSNPNNLIIDYFAPWCPPCLKLLRELRNIHFYITDFKLGTLDCVRYSDICNNIGIGSYPSSAIYLNGNAYWKIGFHSAQDIADHIEDIRNPSVIELNPSNFVKLVDDRKIDETWIVDYFISWCSPCQQLAPVFNKLARTFKNKYSNVFFGTIDCQQYAPFCYEKNVNEYPTIHAFSKFLNKDPVVYLSYWRDFDTMYAWIQSTLHTKVRRKMGENFMEKVLIDRNPWLVYYFRSNCGSYCFQFTHVFESVSKIIERPISFVEVNCEDEFNICNELSVGYSEPMVILYTGSVKGVRQNPEGLYVSYSFNPYYIVGVIEEYIGEQDQLHGDFSTEDQKIKMEL